MNGACLIKINLREINNHVYGLQTTCKDLV